MHCLGIQLNSRRHLLAPLCFQLRSRRRLLLPLRQLCQLCCSFPLPHQQCGCQLHECRPEYQQDQQMMHDLLVSESQRSATYHLLPHYPFSRVVRPRWIFCLVSWTQPDSFHPVVGRPASAQTVFLSLRPLLADSLSLATFDIVELGSENHKHRQPVGLSL